MSDIIPNEDLEFSTERPIHGGQHVGVYAGVSVTHKPTGISCRVDVSRSQFRNKQIAVEMLEAALTSPHFRQD